MDGNAFIDYHKGQAPSKGLLRDCENFADGSFAALLLVNHGLTDVQYRCSGDAINFLLTGSYSAAEAVAEDKAYFEAQAKGQVKEE